MRNNVNPVIKSEKLVSININFYGLKWKVYSRKPTHKELQLLKVLDDIITCFQDTQRQFGTFENFFINIHPNIIMKKEVEKENLINFLDLTLYNMISPYFIHKSSHTDITIHTISVNPYKYRLSLCLNSMVHRLISVDKTENFNKERNTIKK